MRDFRTEETAKDGQLFGGGSRTSSGLLMLIVCERQIIVVKFGFKNYYQTQNLSQSISLSRKTHRPQPPIRTHLTTAGTWIW